MAIHGELSLALLIDVLESEAAMMSAAKMQDILARLAVCSDDVGDHKLFSRQRYARNLVYKSAQFEIMVMCWNSGQRSSIHDHAGALGGLKIISGVLTESLFDKGPNGMIKPSNSIDYEAGSIRVEETSLIHQLSNLQDGDGQAISLHIYAPPLVRMKVYSLEDPSVRNILPEYFSFGSGI